MIKIFSSAQVKAIDQYTIENEPIKSVDLMERAAAKCTQWIIKNIGNNRKVKIFVGSGNNGGDGLAIARQLTSFEYSVTVYLIGNSGQPSDDNLINLDKLKKNEECQIIQINNSNDFPQIDIDDVIIDAIFGSGLSRKISGIQAELIEYLNFKKAIKIAIDIPSGLFSEDVSEITESTIFKADHTLTFQFPFLSFLFKESEPFVGEWHILDIGLNCEIIKTIDTPYLIFEKEDIFLKKRTRFSHKGTYGHALIIAGSYGMIGAAVLSCKACLRSGAGLVTAYIPRTGYNIMQAAVPEVMVIADDLDSHISSIPDISKYSAIAIGPGIGQLAETQNAFKILLKNNSKPLVIDADAINILASNSLLMNSLPKNSIITPHIKEFDRLTGSSANSNERLQKAMTFAKQYQLYIVLKSAYTCVLAPDGKCWFNTIGNPGMATGGSGDVLTGIILSLLAQGYSSSEACIYGVFIHSKAGDIGAISKSQEALITSDIVENIGNAFLDIRKI